MKRNVFFFLFLFLTVGVFLWFSFSATAQLFYYYRLSHRAPVTIEKLGVEEAKKDQYVIKATFSFLFDNKNYNGKAQLDGFYLNPWAAEMAMKHLDEKNWFIWFDPKNPQRNNLQKKFPYKAVISSFVVIAVGLYLFFLGLSQKRVQ